MYGKLKVFLGLSLITVGPGAFALAPSDQYTLDLAGAGNGTSNSAYAICDDFVTAAYLRTPWQACMTNAGGLNGPEKFSGKAAFEGSANNPNVQVNDAFATWDRFDGRQTASSGSAAALETPAFSVINKGYVASDFKPTFTLPPQFLAVSAPLRAPEIDPASAMSGLTLLLGGLAVARGRRARQAA
jgi:hypothetical protein